MGEGLNRVMLLGNVGADPELKVTQGGQAILKMRIATSENYLDKQNVRQEKTEWHSVTMWGKRAEALSRFLTKGTRIFVEGKLHTSSWEKDGEKRYRTEIVATNVLFANARHETERTAERASGAGQPLPAGGATPPADDFMNDYPGGEDDIPFALDATLYGRWDRP